MIAIRNSSIAIRSKINHNIINRLSNQGRFCVNNSRTGNTKANNVNQTRVRVNSTTTSSTTTEDAVPIGKTAVAMCVGIATVASVATILEEATSRYYPTPKFDPTKQQFDQSTFAGRFFRMIAACDPRLLFYSNAYIRECEALVKDYESDSKKGDGDVDDVVLWKAHRMVSVAIHPETGEFIPRPFRMSGYVPCNGPICLAMIASSSTPALLFWGWVNQSQNALINYFNATGAMSNETLAKSYSLAVISALSVVFGLTSIIRKRYSPEQAKQLLKFTAFPSCIVASSLNCYFVRSPEIETGIALLDENGKTVLPGETSQIAAKGGVYSTTASRAILQAPVFFIPPFLLTLPYFKSLITKNPTLTIPLSTFLLLISSGVGLPATIAIFPQIVEMPVQDLEHKYRHLKDAQGHPITKLYYNKGL